MNPWLLFAVFPLAAYVVGSTPFAWLIGRSKGVDLRSAGSGNLGATNVGRVIGKKWGYLCFLLDVAKGFAPVFVTGFLVRRGGPVGLAEQTGWLLTALAAVMGHVLSFWTRFRGGKGVATALGVVLGFWPYFTLPGLAVFALWIVVTLVWRYVSVGSIVAAAAFPLCFLAGERLAGRSIAQTWLLLAFAVAMSALVIFRHRSNIRRLLAGQENKIGAGKGSTAKDPR